MFNIKRRKTIRTFILFLSIFFYWLNSFFFDNENKQIDGYRVKISIIDSGYKSYDNTIKNIKGYSFISEGNENYEDSSGHGTKVTNLIDGMNSNIEFFIAKVLDEYSNGTEEDVISAIEWSIKQDVDIINMSISSYKKSSDLKDVIDKAIREGIIIVAPVGNEFDLKKGISYPAKYSNVLAIGSVNSELKHADFSNIGSELDFVTKGEDIEVITMYGLKEKNSGTSLSAAQVTGIISNILRYDSDLTFEEIYRILEKRSIPKENKNIYGHGILEIEENN